ncbi:MAG: cobalamin biosynthesis protein CobD [Gammaproteobacteria bacterium]|nr:MAG: cobalamin biosynthesis protein CobD [Gammaproteobacteria bacterium]PHR84887.1 MAG: cobalamin biosynthesis protein CobD [Colwellia sp.]
MLALLLDHILGEPKKYHQLVGFGNLANKMDQWLNRPVNQSSSFSKTNAILGTIAWCLLVIPICYLSYVSLVLLPVSVQLIIEVVFLYLALGLNSLHLHAMQVFKPLSQGDLSTARHFTGYLVSRETANLTPKEMSRATVESMLENGHDAVIASLVYYIIGGIPLVILHRLANTLDAMWGYRNTRFNSFGFFAARADDILGFISGKVCTLLYALQQPFLLALKNAYQQGNQYKSHNGGWVMAAGATVMKRTLGGSALYHGKTVHSLVLGMGDSINIEDIPRSINIVRRAAISLTLLVFIYQLASYILV